jgi:hypothetical protein
MASATGRSSSRTGPRSPVRPPAGHRHLQGTPRVAAHLAGGGPLGGAGLAGLLRVRAGRGQAGRGGRRQPGGDAVRAGDSARGHGRSAPVGAGGVGGDRLHGGLARDRPGLQLGPGHRGRPGQDRHPGRVPGCRVGGHGDAVPSPAQPGGGAGVVRCHSRHQGPAPPGAAGAGQGAGRSAGRGRTGTAAGGCPGSCSPVGRTASQ